MNLLLLCHGGRREFGSFELGRDQSVQYRGNFGSNLSYQAAREIVTAIMDDPTVSDERLARGFRTKYDPQPALEGPGGFAPDFNLAGDDRLPCFMMNLSTRKWARLGATWRSRLSVMCGQLGDQAFWLNLLCCANIDEVNVPPLDPHLRKIKWEDLLPGGWN